MDCFADQKGSTESNQQISVYSFWNRKVEIICIVLLTTETN